MGRIPGKIVRWGMVVIFLIFAGIVGASCFITSPEKVVGTVLLTTDNPPVELVASASGKLILLHDPAEPSVLEGTPVACIGKYTDYERIIRLESYLRQSYGVPVGSETGWPRLDSLPEELMSQYAAFRLSEGTSQFDRDREALAAGIRAWKALYLIVAPVAGRLAVTAGRYVHQGEPVGLILSFELPQIIGRMQVTAGYDRIQSGQTVQVRIDALPAGSHEQISGVVERIVPLADTESDLVYLSFPNDLPLKYRTILQTRQLRGTAEIIVSEKSLFRKFMPFTSILP